MQARPCVLLAAALVLAAATTAIPYCFDTETRAQSVDVEGWPVLVALHILTMASATLDLSLSASDDVHTNLTLTHKKQDEKGEKVASVEVHLSSKAAVLPLHTFALLPDMQWATLRLAYKPKELELKVDSADDSSHYTTTALLKTTEDLHVDKVSCSGQGCATLVDLQCLYSSSPTSDPGKSNYTKEDRKGTHAAAEGSSTHREAYYWVLYVALTLLVVASLLFCVWRNERNKFRARWSTHSQAVRQSFTASTQEEGLTPPENGKCDGVRWKAGAGAGHSSLAYNGPYIADSD